VGGLLGVVAFADFLVGTLMRVFRQHDKSSGSIRTYCVSRRILSDFHRRKHLHVDVQACALIWTLHDDEQRLRREMDLMIVSRFAAS
jgi:hypothetical protein